MISKAKLTLLLCIGFLFLHGCKKIQPVFNVYNNCTPEDLQGVTVNSNIMPFSLRGHGMQQLHPVIKLIMDNQPYYFAVDTGSNCNVFGTEDIYNKFLKEYNYSSEYKIRYYSEVNSDYPFIDGILGLPFLKNHKNVTIDYQRQLFIFDDIEISETTIPMKTLYKGLYFIEFTTEGKTEYGLIDTGGIYFVIRPGFGRTPVLQDSKQIQDYIKGTSTVEMKPTAFKKHKILNIGDVQLHDVVSINGDSEQIAALPDAQRFLQVFNNLGTQVFQDHVIQLDFENQVFRIK